MEIATQVLPTPGRGSLQCRIEIKNFHQKMKNWQPSTSVKTDKFQFDTLEIYLKIYPNGVTRQQTGNISIIIVNCTKKDTFFKEQIH